MPSQEAWILYLQTVWRAQERFYAGRLDKQIHLWHGAVQKWLRGQCSLPCALGISVRQAAAECPGCGQRSLGHCCLLASLPPLPATVFLCHCPATFWLDPGSQVLPGMAFSSLTFDPHLVPSPLLTASVEKILRHFGLPSAVLNPGAQTGQLLLVPGWVAQQGKDNWEGLDWVWENLVLFQTSCLQRRE